MPLESWDRWVLAVPGALLVVSVLVMRWARTGWRQGDHPTCRQCDFDLFGNPAAPQCPECGSDLSLKKARAIGVRVVRRKSLYASRACAAFFGCWFALAAIDLHAGIKWIQLKPESMLLEEILSNDMRVQMTAMAELRRRAQEEDLSRESQLAIVDQICKGVVSGRKLETFRAEGWIRDVQKLVEADGSTLDLNPWWGTLAKVIAMEGDPRRSSAASQLLTWYDRGSSEGGDATVPPEILASVVEPLLALQTDAKNGNAEWTRECGDLFIAAQLHGLVSEPQMERYVRGGFIAQPKISGPVRPRSPLAIEWDLESTHHSPPYARPGNPEWVPNVFGIELSFNGGPNVLTERGRAGDVIRNDTKRNLMEVLGVGETGLPAAGKHVATLKMTFGVGRTGKYPDRAWHETLEVPVDVLTDARPVVVLVTDPAKTQAIRKAFGLDDADGEPACLLRVSDPHEGVEMLLPVPELPVDLAVTVTLRDPATGKTWGPVVGPVITSDLTLPIAFALIDARAADGFSLDVVDVVLTPDPRVAAQTPGVLKIWGEPIVLERVPVQWEAGVTRPIRPLAGKPYPPPLEPLPQPGEGE